jgi:recombinational DNA repair protein RecT
MSTATKPKQSTEVAQPEKIRGWFSAPGVHDGLASALAGYMDADAFINQMLIAFTEDAIAPCTAASKFEAAHQCAALGLLPSLKQVALIPRQISGKGLCCTVMPQWQGYQALMLRHPDVQSVKAVLVHISDRYTFDPVNESLLHEYDPFDGARKFQTVADLRGGYLVVKYKDARPPLYHFVTADTVSKAQSCAQAQNIWTKWFAEQALKTVYRNAYARRVVPIDHLVHSRLQELVHADDVALENDPGRVVVIEQPPAGITHTPKSRTQQVAQKMASPVAETESAPEQEQAPAETAKKPPAKPSKDAALPFDVQITKAETLEQLEAIYEALGKANLVQDEYNMYHNMLTKKQAKLQG